MPKFISIPTTIDAEQWFPGKRVYGVHENEVVKYPEGEYHITKPAVVTIHGQVTPVAPADWIIPEPDNLHHYPVKHEIFIKKYRLLSENKT